MSLIIDSAFSRARVFILTFCIILVAGMIAYNAIPKESEPDVVIPMIYVSMSHEGISPEDAERLLVRPMEKQLQSLEGLKELKATAGEGHASVMLEFDAGFNPEKALQDVREKVDIAKSELPPDTNEPHVAEVNVALFPVLAVSLSGPIPERALISIASRLKDHIEALPGVLKVEIGGNREEMMEIIVDPNIMSTYNISFSDIAALLRNNNQLVAAGALNSNSGRMVLKVPGVIEDLDDILNMPIKVVDDTIVSFKDVATIRRGYKDPDGYARVNGEKALVLEVTKRVGANIIQTIESVRAVINEAEKIWPESIQVDYLQDKSKQIKDMLGDLENNVITAIVLVMIVIIGALGLKAGLLVGLSIPGSFLAGILVLYGMGYTLNIVVLFSLILVVGMLVDGAIVTIELADKKLQEGATKKEAYKEASKRMSWPIIASTATTLAVFFPLISWPGVVGEFMKYLPITVIITLSCSLFMALIFVPILGGTIGKSSSVRVKPKADNEDLQNIKGVKKAYIHFLDKQLRHPWKTFFVAVGMLIVTYWAYISFGKGVEFFPTMEPEFVQVQIQSRGDLSLIEKDKLVRRVEEQLFDLSAIKTIYAKTLSSSTNQQNIAEDVIGIIQVEFTHWRERPSASVIITNIRERVENIPGILIQVMKQEGGPSAGKPIQIEIRSADSSKLAPAVEKVRDIMSQLDGFQDIEDSRPLLGIEWRLEVNREQAAKYGADVVTLGSAVQMLTGGLKLAEYNPDDADKELDIRLRFPFKERGLEQLKNLEITTLHGQIPARNFIQINPQKKTSLIKRTNGHRVLTIQANVEEGVLVDQQTKMLKVALDALELDPMTTIHFKGQDADQKEAGIFLTQAFLTAIFLMVLILLLQFNSFYQAGLILSAIIFSTAGVLLGLLVTGNPFGIVMGGIGLIALAGIVVNNNIVLIDTYNDLKSKMSDPREAILLTASQRVRPVLLTSITTVLGLLPMVFAISINLVDRDISFGAPSTQWWIQLSSAIAGGLTCATILTLILTPCMLMLGEHFSLKWKRRGSMQSKNDHVKQKQNNTKNKNDALLKSN